MERSHGLKKASPFSAATEATAREIVDGAFLVHNELGPGLLESVYEECLCLVLEQKGLEVQRQVEIPILFSGEVLTTRLKLDLFVNQSVVVELKAVEKMQPLYQAQLMTYLKLTGTHLGFLINFNVPRIKEGIKRIVL